MVTIDQRTILACLYSRDVEQHPIPSKKTWRSLDTARVLIKDDLMATVLIVQSTFSWCAQNSKSFQIGFFEPHMSIHDKEVHFRPHQLSCECILSSSFLKYRAQIVNSNHRFKTSCLQIRWSHYLHGKS